MAERDVNDEAFARYILASERGAPGGTPDREPIAGAHVYRRIVRASLDTVIANALPVTREVLGEERFGELLAAFYAAGGPATSLYRDIPGDFARWAEETEQPLADLIHWEWLDLIAARHPAELDELPPATPGLLRPNPTMQAGVYTRPVHTIDADDPDPEPYPGPMAILVWRRPRTDATEHYPVGLLIARALAEAAASEAPPSIEAVSRALAAQTPGVSEVDLRARLEEVAAVLGEKEGLVG